MQRLIQFKQTNLFKPVKFLVIGLWLGVILSACGGGDTSSRIESKPLKNTSSVSPVIVPQQIRSLALPDDSIMSAFVMIDGKNRKEMDVNENTGTASFNFEGLSVGEHEITFEFIVTTIDGQEYTVASYQRMIDVEKGENDIADLLGEEVVVDNYTFDYDSDNDGLSDFCETLENLEDYNSDGQTCAGIDPATPRNPAIPVNINSDITEFAVSGFMSGLNGQTLTLSLNGISRNFTGNVFSFDSNALENGTSYTVAIELPENEDDLQCSIANETGVMAADVTNVAVSCQSYSELTIVTLELPLPDDLTSEKVAKLTTSGVITVSGQTCDAVTVDNTIDCSESTLDALFNSTLNSPTITISASYSDVDKAGSIWRVSNIVLDVTPFGTNRLSVPLATRQAGDIEPAMTTFKNSFGSNWDETYWDRGDWAP